MTSYPTPTHRRIALAPAVIAAVCLLVGSVLIGADAYVAVLYVVSILALIVAVFAWQARHWWWLAGLLPIAIAWNPVFPLQFDGDLWRGAHYIAALVFIAAGILIRVVNTENRNIRR